MLSSKAALDNYKTSGTLPKADQSYDFLYDACYGKGLNIELRRLPNEKGHEDIFKGKTDFKGFVLVISRADVGLCRVEISGIETLNGGATRAYQILKQKNIL